MINDQTYIALASAVVAVCALVITFWQAYIMRKHNKLSVRPFLTTQQHHAVKDDVGTVVFTLENCGVGPAIIKNFVLLNKNDEICRNNSSSFDSFLKKQANSCSDIHTGYHVPESALSTNTIHRIFSFNYNVKKQNVSFIHNLNLIIEYQSMYKDEVFVYDSRKDRQYHGLEVSETLSSMDYSKVFFQRQKKVNRHE